MKSASLLLAALSVCSVSALSAGKGGAVLVTSAKDLNGALTDRTVGKAVGVINGEKVGTSHVIQPEEITHKGKEATTVEESSEYNSFLMSISMIVVSEIGDKTFLIAALMAMRSSRLVVFTAAFASLAIMTVLSGIVGHVLPALIPQRATQFLAAVLFVVFGFKLVREGLAMSKELGVAEEMAEVEEEIASSAINSRSDAAEAGRTDATERSLVETATEALTNLAGFVFSPVWVQVFVMTFLGEWGDRSQIATIAMAAGSDYWFVILGAIVGHGICTAGAVVGGKLLASRISMRTVTLGGAAAFFVFAVIYLYEAVFNLDASA